MPPVCIDMSDVGGVAVEAYDILVTNLAFTSSERALQALVLTSPLSGDGKTTTAVNLALALAMRGQRVCLIDGDIRRGAVHTVFDQPRGPGLTDILAGDVSLEEALRPVRVGDTGTLQYLAAGKPVSDPTRLLESGGMESLLNRLRAQYQTILLDSSPVNAVTDAVILSRITDATLLVVRTGVTDSAALALACEQLRQVRAPVVGVILNGIDFSRDAAYDNAYRDYDRDRYAIRRA
jgi:capsular exopolysaccharide synthesis family protein